MPGSTGCVPPERRARRSAWAAGAAPAQTVLDIDATLVTAHSEKEGATANYKRGFGFHPLLCFADLDDDGVGGDALAGILRSGRAGANDVADHISGARPGPRAASRRPAAAPRRPGSGRPCWCAPTAPAAPTGSPPRCANAAASSPSASAWTSPCSRRFSELPAAAWAPALDSDGDPRDGAEVAELTGLLDLSRWPEGTRAIVRRERPHPGAQLRFTDDDGWRFQVFLTDTGHGIVAHQLAGLEVRHRAHARVEDRIRAAKATGLVNFPCRALPENRAWLELVLAATDLRRS